MKKILSIIVPSYNMEALLENDLQSLVIDKGRERLEVIVVNDGSKDRTLDIARDFEKRYPQMFTVIDKPNGNYGSCINAGLKAATGKYVKIMDADDHFDTANFEAFIDCLANIDVDMVVNDYRKQWTGGKTEDFSYNFPTGKVLKISDIYSEETFSNLLLPALTYRLSIIKDMNYRQTEGISYTDMEWCFAPVTQMSSFYYFNRPVYIYMMGREGQTMDPAVYRKRLPQLFECMHSLLESLCNLKLAPWAQRFVTEQLSKHGEHVYRYLLIRNQNEPRELLRRYDNELKEKCPTAYKICGRLEYRKKIPYHFVEEWRTRRHEYTPASVRFKEIIYDTFGTIHYHILKLSNPDLKR